MTGTGAPAPPPLPRAPVPPVETRRHTDRKWTPVLLVAMVLFIVVVGGQITQAALSTERGAPVGVAGVVRIRPLSGWRVVGRVHVHGIPDLRVTRGTGNLEVLAAPFAERGSGQLVRLYLHDIVAPQAKQLQVSSTLETVSLGGGVVASRGFYIGLFGDRGTPIEGEVTAVTRQGEGIVFDGWAPSGMYQYVQGDVHTMIDGARFG